LLRDSTQQLNWIRHAFRLSLAGTKWNKWAWTPDYSSSFPYDKYTQFLVRFSDFVTSSFNINIYNINIKCWVWGSRQKIKITIFWRKESFSCLWL
jgi:hypothetical protein